MCVSVFERLQVGVRVWFNVWGKNEWEKKREGGVCVCLFQSSSCTIGEEKKSWRGFIFVGKIFWWREDVLVVRTAAQEFFTRWQQKAKLIDIGTHYIWRYKQYKRYPYRFNCSPQFLSPAETKHVALGLRVGVVDVCAVVLLRVRYCWPMTDKSCFYFPSSGAKWPPIICVKTGGGSLDPRTA